MMLNSEERRAPLQGRRLHMAGEVVLDMEGAYSGLSGV